MELTAHFNKIRNFSIAEIRKCEERLDGYMKRFTEMMMNEINK